MQRRSRARSKQSPHTDARRRRRRFNGGRVLALNDRPASPWCAPMHLTYPYHRSDGARISPGLYRRNSK